MIPRVIYAGDLVSWTEPAPERGTASRVFNAPGMAAVVTASATAEPDGQLRFSLSAEDTAVLPSGRVEAFLIVTGDDGGREVLCRDAVEVLPNPLTPGADLRSPVKKTLDALRLAVSGSASEALLERTVDGVTIRYATPETLARLLNRYELLYAMECGGNVLPRPAVQTAGGKG